MPNCVFQFKHFAVWSHIGGFKVGTDAVLLGAWANVGDSTSILEVGAGTGVISLMLAQRTHGVISVVELDDKAVKQAAYNFERSPFGRLKVYHSSIQDFADNSTIRFDHIVCNPPYFQFSSKPDSDTLHKAKHTDNLSPSELISCSEKLINENGKLSIVIPFSDQKSWIDLARSKGFYPIRKLLVRPALEYEFKRVLIEFGRVEGKGSEQEITLEEGDRKKRTYTKQFQDLMNDYFIRF